jgi:hypothetical protein
MNIFVYELDLLCKKGYLNKIFVSPADGEISSRKLFVNQRYI